MTFRFDRSCPAGPVWWIEWIADPDVDGYDDDVEWDEIEADLEADEVFRDLMDVWDPHPADDSHVTYYRTESPMGVSLIVIQHSGIEHVWSDDDIDIEQEEEEAEDQGFWYLE